VPTELQQVEPGELAWPEERSAMNRGAEKEEPSIQGASTLCQEYPSSFYLCCPSSPC
jgi:hypothetical protein